jgi:hypothetical protein
MIPPPSSSRETPSGDLWNSEVCLGLVTCLFASVGLKNRILGLRHVHKANAIFQLISPTKLWDPFGEEIGRLEID